MGVDDGGVDGPRCGVDDGGKSGSGVISNTWANLDGKLHTSFEFLQTFSRVRLFWSKRLQDD